MSTETTPKETFPPASKREQRRLAAEARRAEWRHRWVDIIKNEPNRTIRQQLKTIADDAERLMRDTPALKSEIQLALDEFVDRLAAAIARVSTGEKP